MDIQVHDNVLLVHDSLLGATLLNIWSLSN